MSRVTIVIPNHNYGKWIVGAIDSVFTDPYQDKNIVVVNDGCTDDSWRIICNLIPEFNYECTDGIFSDLYKGIYVTVINLPQANGPSYARNIAIKLLWDSTDIFGFLDADDEYRNGKITKSVVKIEADPNIGAVYTDYDIVNEEGLIKREYKEPFSRERLVRECIVHSACVISKSALDKCGLYDETMRTCEDYDLWMRISEKFCITHIADPLMLVRTHSQNSTSTVAKNIWDENWLKVMTKAKERNNG